MLVLSIIDRALSSILLGLGYGVAWFLLPWLLSIFAYPPLMIRKRLKKGRWWLNEYDEAEIFEFALKIMFSRVWKISTAFATVVFMVTWLLVLFLLF